MSIRFARLLAPAIPSLLALALTGCGMTTSTLNSAVGGASTTIAASGSNPSATPSTTIFNGNVHGGQQPVTGATVTLWAAGTTATSSSTNNGYGQGATPIVTSTTDALGNFSLDPQTTVGITAYSYTNGTVTFTSNAAVPTGQTVVIRGFPTSTFLNGGEVVASSSTPTSFTGSLSVPNYTSASITAYSITSNVATFTATNLLSTGDVVTLNGFPTSTFFNGQQVTVLTATNTSFTAAFTNSDVAATTEAGTVTLNTAPPVTETASASYTSSTVSSCSAGQYLYITAVGGNPGLAGTYGTISNSNIALMAALPSPCSPATTGTSFVTINELTTASAIWALQQFMSINTSGVEPTTSSQATPPWTIGAPASNVTGMANAFATSATMVNTATGKLYGTTGTNTSVTNTIAGAVYQTQITADYLRLNTIADILAACVNTAGGSGSTCASLISDTTPSTNTAPIDTMQIAYYMATQPSGFQMPQHGLNSPYWLCYNYVTASAPFQGTETCSGSTPTFYDWVMVNGWTLYITPSGSQTSTKTALIPASVAIDGTGNIWVGGGSGYATVGPLNEFNPAGQLIYATPASVTLDPSSLPLTVNVDSTFGATPTTTGTIPFASQTITYANTSSYGRPYSVAIDTNGNAWMSNGSAPGISPASGTAAGSTFGLGMLTEVPVTNGVAGTAVGILGPQSPAAMAFDANNNMFLSNEGYGPGSRYYVSVMSAPVAGSTFYSGDGRQTSVFNDIVADQAGHGIAGMQSGATCTTGNTSTMVRDTAAIMEVQPISPSTTGAGTADVVPGTCAFYMAVDTNNNLWGTNATTLNFFDFSTTTPTVVALPTQASTYPTTGLLTPAAVAIDGASNIWVLSNNSSGVGVNEFTSKIITGSGATDAANVTTSTVLSPSSTNTTYPAAGFLSTSKFTTASKLEGLVIDGSGNVWIQTNAGSSMYMIVGAAAPVKTPIASALGNTAGTAGSLGHRP